MSAKTQKIVYEQNELLYSKNADNNFLQFELSLEQEKLAQEKNNILQMVI